MTAASCGLRSCVIHQCSAGLRAGCACQRATNLRTRTRDEVCTIADVVRTFRGGPRIVREAARTPPTVWCTTQNRRRHDAAGFVQLLRAGGPHMNSKRPRTADGSRQDAGGSLGCSGYGGLSRQDAGRHAVSRSSFAFRCASAHLKSGAGRTAGGAYVTDTKPGRRTRPRHYPSPAAADRVVYDSEREAARCRRVCAVPAGRRPAHE